MYDYEKMKAEMFEGDNASKYSKFIYYCCCHMY